MAVLVAAVREVVGVLVAVEREVVVELAVVREELVAVEQEGAQAAAGLVGAELAVGWAAVVSQAAVTVVAGQAVGLVEARVDLGERAELAGLGELAAREVAAWVARVVV